VITNTHIVKYCNTEIGVEDLNTEPGAQGKMNKKLGTILGLVGFVIVVATVALWIRQVDLVALPENRTPFVVAFLTAAGLGIGAFITGTRWFGGVAATFAIILGFFLVFTVAISRQQVVADGIGVGDVIPHFTAIDEHGQFFDSESLHGHIILIKFFRAHW
jgi:hypothetical protein